ncbi:GNAT family acetyltransferase [Microbacterium sp. CBS5P-1]|nr:GNAT family acetyltransferase [Microbacterium excoecariae]
MHRGPVLHALAQPRLAPGDRPAGREAGRCAAQPPHHARWTRARHGRVFDPRGGVARGAAGARSARGAGAVTVRIRSFAPGDEDAVVALWEAAALTRSWNDPRADIARARSVWPDLLLVADAGGAVVGSVMAGYDGHRGWLSYLAADPARRGEGIGAALVAEAERRLTALGCPKVQLMVRRENAGVLGFYDALGYEPVEVEMRGKRLIPDA